MKVACRLFVMTMALCAAANTGGAIAQDWQDGAGAEWVQTLAAARREGKVVVAGPPPLARVFAEEFKRDTGIELEFLGGTVRDITARFQREVAAGKLTIDLLLGGGTELTNSYPQGLLKEIKSQLVLPGVVDGKNWRGGKIKWLDNEGAYFLQGSNWVHAWPLVNTNLVKPGSLLSWKDLIKPEFKGKIVAFDPRSGGPGQSAASYLAHQFGIDFIKLLYQGQDVVYTRDGRQMTDWIVRGNYAVALGAVQVDVEQFTSRGIKNIEVPTMNDGAGTMIGGFSLLKQPKGGPNPNAAKVFINWYASKPGQTAYTRVMLEPSTRVDVDVPGVPEYVKLKAGERYLDQYDQNWYLNERPKVEKAIVDALGGR